MSPALRLLRFATMAAICGLAACASLSGVSGVPGEASSSSGDAAVDAAIAIGRLEVSTKEVVFADTHCGSDWPSAAIVLRNDGDDAIDWDVALPSESVFKFEDGTTSARGRVSANATANVTFMADITRPGKFGGEILVTTTEGVVPVQVSAIVNGAELEISPAIVDFGEVRKETATPSQTVTIANKGNEAVTITELTGLSSDFSLLPKGPLTLEPKAAEPASLTVALKAGPPGAPLSATLTPAVSTPLCGSSPTLKLQGTRVNRDVLVNPLTTSFGSVDCSSSPTATREVVISNYGSGAISGTVTLPADSWFTAVPNGPFVVPGATGGNAATLKVALGLRPVGAVTGNHVEKIQVTVNTTPEPATYTVETSVKSVGAIVTVTPVVLDIGTGSQTFQITNTGNEDIDVTTSSSNPAFQVGLRNFINQLVNTWRLGPDKSVKPRVSLSTSIVGVHQTKITTAQGNLGFPWPSVRGPLCNAPPPVSVTGTKPPPSN